MKEGRCGNFGGCTKADSHELIPIQGQDAICPECGLPLTVKEKKRFPTKWLFVLLALLAVAGLIKACYPTCPNGQNTDGTCKPPPCGEFGQNADGSCKRPPCGEFGQNADGSCKPPPCGEFGQNADGSCKPPPCGEFGQNADGSCKPPPPEANCTLNPADKPAKPNSYSVIEIGSKGIKPVAVEFLPDNGHYIPYIYDQRQPENVGPRDPAKIPDVVNALCNIINSLHADYGNIPVFLVGSSSMREMPHHEQLDKAVADKFKSLRSVKTPVIGEAVDYLTADREAEYLSKGIWVPPLPTTRHCQSLVVDVGSGNIKGGYIEHCNPKKESSPEEVFTTFEIPNFGTTAFTKRTKPSDMSSYAKAAAITRNELAQKLDQVKQRHPHLLAGKSRVYVVGGAAWALSTLLCLDCPQYRERSTTDDINEYTVIKPSDIEEFYNFVINHRDEVCSAEQNPYTRKDLDGGSKILPLYKEDMDKHNHDMADVCRVFKPDDLVSAAEILRTLADKLGVSEKRRLFFMQKNLYTWSRQYLIEKLSKPQ